MDDFKRSIWSLYILAQWNIYVKYIYGNNNDGYNKLCTYTGAKYVYDTFICI